MIDSKLLEKLFLGCLFKEEEIPESGIPKDAVIVEGIMSKYGLHPERLSDCKDEVFKMLEELPAQFHKNTGGGWSFLNMCNDKDGDQWTGSHKIMEQLVVLGIGLGAVSFSVPREIWPSLPGGVPYLVVDLEGA